MSVRNILVPVRGDGKGEGLLDHGVALARRFNAHIDVLHCRPRPEDMLPFGVFVPTAVREQITSSAANLADEEEKRLVSFFRKYCKRRELKISESRPWPKDEVSIAWREMMGRQTTIVAVQGRLADVVVVAQPDRERNIGFRTLESALFETGRLVLMCPPKPVERIGVHVAIAWNGSTESARAVATAMSVLKAADSVTVLSVDTGAPADLDADALIAHLAGHQVEAGKAEPKSGASEVGQTLLASAADAGADVLLMGTYGQSRQFELIMGGVTRHIVEHAEMPVLLTH